MSIGDLRPYGWPGVICSPGYMPTTEAGVYSISLADILNPGVYNLVYSNPPFEYVEPIYKNRRQIRKRLKRKAAY
jgi:hypothetical protein